MEENFEIGLATIFMICIALFGVFVSGLFAYSLFWLAFGDIEKGGFALVVFGFVLFGAGVSALGALVKRLVK